MPAAVALDTTVAGGGVADAALTMVGGFGLPLTIIAGGGGVVVGGGTTAGTAGAGIGRVDVCRRRRRRGVVVVRQRDLVLGPAEPVAELEQDRRPELLRVLVRLDHPPDRPGTGQRGRRPEPVEQRRQRRAGPGRPGGLGPLDRRRKVRRHPQHQVVGRQQEAHDQREQQREPGAGRVDVRLQVGGRPDAEDAALALGEAVLVARLEVVGGRRVGDGEEDRADDPHPRVADPAVGGEQDHGHAGEEQGREGPLADDREDLVGDERPDRPAPVARRRPRRHRVARPVRRREPADRQEQEGPRPAGQRHRNPTPEVGAFHSGIRG